MNELEQQQLVQWVLLCKIVYNVIFGLEIRQRTAELFFSLCLLHGGSSQHAPHTFQFWWWNLLPLGVHWDV